jgi:hypothetical protein
MDLSKDCACVSHASDILGVRVMALLHTETEYWEEGIVPSLLWPGSLSVGFLAGLA